MPKAKFEAIFHDLRQRIEEGQYPFQSLLPSENQLTELYSCSRNTIRRATSGLAELGYVQPLHGRGVRVIYQPIAQNEFTIGGIESFKESAARNHMQASTLVLRFAEIVADERLSRKTGFPVGSTLYDIRRVRCLDGKALISGKTVEEAGGAIGADGVFSIELSIPDYNGSLSHAVTVSAADRNGNATEDYEAVISAWDANVTRLADDERRVLDEEARKAAEKNRDKRMQDALNAF